MQPEIAMQAEISLHTWIAAAHWLAGLIVLAEGLNKLERSAPLQPGLSPRARIVVLLKVAAWVVLVLGAGGAVIRPLIVPGIEQRIETLTCTDAHMVVAFRTDMDIRLQVGTVQNCFARRAFDPQAFGDGFAGCRVGPLDAGGKQFFKPAHWDLFSIFWVAALYRSACCAPISEIHVKSP